MLRSFFGVLAVLILAVPLRSDDSAPAHPDPHIMGVIPNYKTVENPSEVVPPMTVKAKFVLAAHDSFDPRSLPVTGLYSAIGQLRNQYPSFGQGMAGFGKRYAGNYVDQAIGNMIGEAVVPVLFHEDPRYYRLGSGGPLKRVTYSFTRIFVAHTDAGGRHFNYGEFLGNGLGAAISTAYYPAEDRNAHAVLSKAAIQTLTDGAFNVGKEYWPDIRRKLFHK
jgi:hypothetical protein